MSTEEFKSLCKTALPYLDELSCIFSSFSTDMAVSIYFSNDGYIGLQIKGNGWRLRRTNSQAEPEVCLETVELLFSDEDKDSH